ncbi:MAG: tetratricopeptide repeat protein, partial [Candidatus Hodarchaeota archaeon]
NKVIESLADVLKREMGFNPAQVLRYFQIFPSESMGDWYYLKDIQSHAALRFNYKTKDFKLLNQKNDWNGKRIDKFRKSSEELKDEFEKNVKQMEKIRETLMYKKLKPVLKWYKSSPIPDISKVLYSPSEFILRVLNHLHKELDLKDNNLKRVRDSFFKAYRYERDELKSKGYKQLFNGEFENAINIFRKSLTFYPKDNVALHSIADALVKLKRYEESIEYSEKAIKITSHDFDAWKIKGLGLLALGEFKEAIISFDKCLSLNPGYKDALLAKAEALHKSGNIEEAINFYKEVLAQDPNNELALSALNKLKNKL